MQGGQIQAQPGLDGSQNLGALFPDELGLPGVTLAYTPPVAAAAASAPSNPPTYQFTLLIDQVYLITLGGSQLPQGASLLVQPLTGAFNRVASFSAGTSWFGEFAPGSYEITVEGMPSGTPYQINFSMEGTADNPVPLVSGAAPALQLHFDTIAPLIGSGDSAATGGGESGEVTGNPPDGPGGLPPGGGVTSNPPSAPGGSVSSGGGQSTSSTPVGGGGSGVIFGPNGFGPSASSVATVTSGNGNAAQPPLLVTLNVPIESPSTAPAAGIVGGATGAATGEGSAASITASAGGAGAASQVANLISANLSLLGVGPVGGVQQSGTMVAASQGLQVALPTQGSSPIPTALLSVVTLTQTGELGDLPAPVDPVAVAAGGGLVAIPAVVSLNPPRLAGPFPRGAEALRKLAAFWARSRALSADAEISGDSEIATSLQLAAVTPLSAVADPEAGRGGSATADEGVPNVESLATANGPWLILIGVLGTVTLYARQRRQARRTAAARRFEKGAQRSKGVYRLWGLRLPAGRGLPHEIRTVGPIGVAKRRSDASGQPRHMTNS